MKEYSVLLIGRIYDNHMFRFVRNLKQTNPLARIDGFAFKEEGRELPDDYVCCFHHLEITDCSFFFKNIPIFSSLELINVWRKFFRAFSIGRHYDVVNIHFPLYLYSFIINDIKIIADRIILTPWGSDVYRINKYKRFILKRLYDAADFVTGPGDRFTKDFMRIFNVPQKKLLLADIGSETIDYIIEHKSIINSVQAKQRLGLDGTYVISCGYNASLGQQHEKIIEAIGRIKDQIPSDLVLLFPVTYPNNPKYIIHLKAIVAEKGIKSIWFEEYLDQASFFIMQQATDMFIHVQTTDANSISLKEYLLLEKNCVNGAWLKYDDLEQYGNKPYHVVDSIDLLEDSILNAYRIGAPMIPDPVLSYIETIGCKSTAERWDKLFNRVCTLDCLI